MFIDCARTLHIDTSAWSAVPIFQPPPPPPPMAPTKGVEARNDKEAPVEGTEAQHDLKAVIGKENFEVDF